MARARSVGKKNKCLRTSMLGLIESLEFVLPKIPADAKIVPGHGQISTRADNIRGYSRRQDPPATNCGKASRQMESIRTRVDFVDG